MMLLAVPNLELGIFGQDLLLELLQDGPVCSGKLKSVVWRILTDRRLCRWRHCLTPAVPSPRL